MPFCSSQLGENNELVLQFDHVYQHTRLSSACADGDYEQVCSILGSCSPLDQYQLLESTDNNGWQPLHEAVRNGNPDTVTFLIEHGADISAVTKQGASPLWWARYFHGDNHPIVEYLESIGAPETVHEL